jgi:hypothetical protein
MAAKSNRALARHKSKSIIVVPNVAANILFIHPEIRRRQAYKDWQTALRAYIHTLSNDEEDIVRKCMTFIIAEPDKREHLHGPCPVVSFPIQNKRSKQGVQ